MNDKDKVRSDYDAELDNETENYITDENLEINEYTMSADYELSDDDSEHIYNDVYMNRKETRRKIEARRAEQVNKQKKIIMISVPAVVIIALLILVIMKLSGASDNTRVTPDSASVENEDNNTNSEISSVDNSVSEENEEQGLTKNTDEDIDELVNKYYTAISSCDIESLQECVDDIGDITAESLEAMAQYIEAYENIECYVKPGLDDNSYIIYVYYENKILNIDTLAPGAATLLSLIHI